MRLTQKIIYGSLVTVFFSAIMKLWLFDFFVAVGIRDQTSLRKRNEIRDLYLKIPFPLNFKIYFFNVSNPMEIQNGHMPIVQEVGPYWYDEFKEKVDVVENDSEDSLTYSPHDIFKFNQNKSGSLTDDDYVTILNPLMVGMVNQVMQDQPALISIVKQTLPHIFNNPKSIFLTIKVKDILFDGVEINCTSKDFATNAVCGQLRNKIPGVKFKEGDEKIYLFSLLGVRNGTQKTRIKVLRGINESKDLGRLMEFDGKKKINLWNTEKCNRFEGTDGWIFPPLLTPEEGLHSFSTDLCRNFRVDYKYDTIVKGIKVRIYEADLGDQSTNEEEKCYCRTPETCLKKGLADLGKCLGVPIIATLPHFLHTDESYLSEIQGLKPDDDKHALRVAFEPMTGGPLWAAKRMQFNFNIQANKKVGLFENLPTALFPLLWLEESAELEGYILKKLQVVFFLLKLTGIMLYVIIAGGLISLGAAIFYDQKNKRTVSITPVYEIKKNKDNGVVFGVEKHGVEALGVEAPGVEAHGVEAPGVEAHDVEANDMPNLTRRRGTNGTIGHTMTGHEFGRY